MKAIICPISIEKIDSNVSRLTAFLSVVFLVAFMVTLNPIFIILVSLDFFIRATMNNKYSPIRFAAVGIVRAMNLKKKPINLAQKVFASRLGFLCALTSLILFVMGYNTGSLIVAALLMTLSIMDAVFKFCVGCLIYNYLVYPFYKNK